MVSSVPSVAVKNTERNRKIHPIEVWLTAGAIGGILFCFLSWGDLFSTMPAGDIWSSPVSRDTSPGVVGKL